MELKLTRRRFGQLAIASSATVALTYLADKTFAQQTGLVLYGARAAARSPNPGGVFFQSITLPSNTIGNLPLGPIVSPLETGEKLTGFTTLADGTLVLSISPVRAGKKEDNPDRLVFLGASPKTLTVSGLKKQERLESWLSTNDGSLFALRIKKNARPPVDLVSINTSTGEISLVNKIKLPQTERFTNLAQGSDGSLYSIAIDGLGEASLVKLDLGNGKVNVLAPLKINGNQRLNNGLQDLVASPGSSEQLLALGALRQDQIPLKLYTVNVNTGNMELITPFDVTKITTAPV